MLMFIDHNMCGRVAYIVSYVSNCFTRYMLAGVIIGVFTSVSSEPYQLLGGNCTFYFYAHFIFVKI
jgi:hypothetical protein